MTNSNGHNTNGEVPKQRSNTANGNGNLKPPWKPGQSGNPKGRPKGRSVTYLLKELLKEHDSHAAEAVARALLEGALKGDIRHIQEVLNRTDGKVPDKLESRVQRIAVDFENRAAALMEDEDE